RLRLRADLAEIVALDGLLQLHDPALDRRGLGLVELVAVLLQAPLGRVREALRVVAGIGQLAQAMRLVGVGLGVVDHPLDLVVLRSISFVNTPPLVSMPSESGVTSSRSTSLTSPRSTPAWMAAPTATTSSGFTPLCGSLPTISLTFSWTAGIRVMPPTRTTWS